MDVDIKFDRNWDRTLADAIKPQMREITADMQRFFDDFGRRYKGKPVPVIHAALRSEWTRRGGSMNESEYANYAQLIHDGVNIEVKLGY